jgi:hypothetical protein
MSLYSRWSIDAQQYPKKVEKPKFDFKKEYVLANTIDKLEGLKMKVMMMDSGPDRNDKLFTINHKIRGKVKEQERKRKKVEDNLVEDNLVEDNLVEDNLVEDNLVEDNKNSCHTTTNHFSTKEDSCSSLEYYSDSDEIDYP